MKLTTARLRQLIKEEIQSVILNESKIKQALSNRMDNDLYAPQGAINIKIMADSGAIISNWSIFKKMNLNDLINSCFAISRKDTKTLLANILRTKMGPGLYGDKIAQEAPEELQRFEEFYQSKIYPRMEIILSITQLDLPNNPEKKLHSVRFRAGEEAPMNEWFQQFKALKIYTIISKKLK